MAIKTAITADYQNTEQISTRREMTHQSGGHKRATHPQHISARHEQQADHFITA